MKPEEKNEVSQQLAWFATIYPTLNFSEHAQRMWIAILDDLDIRDVRIAFIAFARDIDDFPTPGKIRKLATEAGVVRRNKEAESKPKTESQLYYEQYQRSKGSPEAKAAIAKVLAKLKAKDEAKKC
jgi:hypothetical protein